MDTTGFYKKTIDQRLDLLLKNNIINQEELNLLKKQGNLELETANIMIENVIGTISLPFALCPNFLINKEMKLIPMAIEEPSVVAAASKAAKLCINTGGFTCISDEPIMRGQVQILTNLENIEKIKDILDEIAKSQSKTMEKYGGGFISSNLRKLDGFILYEFDINVCDSMGANRINTIAEEIGKTLNEKGYDTGLKIITNLAINRLCTAKAKWNIEDIGGEKVAKKIILGYELAKQDIFRCSTHNKGIMNGIDAVCVATSNDFRAIEAGAHVYSIYKNKKYAPLTKYFIEGNYLCGEITLPCAVAIVGGATKTNPISKIALKILNLKNSKEFSCVIASVGLAQNFAALLAMATKGINFGHMKLHSKNIALTAGAKNEEIEKISKKMIQDNKISVEYAKEILNEIRN